MKTFIALALAGAASAITHGDIKFMDYLAKHGKGYETIKEFNFRAAIFANKDAELAKINANPENTFTVGHNFTSDMTKKELLQLRGSFEEEDSDKDLPALNMELVKTTGLIDEGLVQGTTNYPISYPSSIDWRAKGGVTAVKYQSTCGACWAFAGIAALEGVWFHQQGQTIQLSEQQVIDCNPKGYQCNGGTVLTALEYVQANKIKKETKYPFKSKQGACKADGTGAKIQDITKVIPGSVDGLKTAIARGPTPVILASYSTVFNNYEKGVINNATACGISCDHAVTAVGYTSNYYIIKNSWSNAWGENGFAKIAINGSGDGMCGIQKGAYTPYKL